MAFKILPDGTESSLSLNSLRLCGLSENPELEEFDLKTGGEILSNQVIYRLKEKNLRFDEFAVEIGRRMAAILFVLKNNKTDWLKYNQSAKENDRLFWRQCRFIYLAGYYFKGNIGERIKEYILSCLRRAGIQDLTLILCNTKYTPSLIGCGIFRGDSVKDRLVFDFGHTNIKRGVVKYNHKVMESLKELSTISVQAIQAGITGDELNKYIVKVISTTYWDLLESGVDLSKEIVLCISNNILNGQIMNRGIYGTLKELGENYPLILEKSLKKRGVDVTIYMLNDVKAITYLCNHDPSKTVVISLGTNLGIAYPGLWY